MSVDYQTMIRIISQIVWPMGRISGLIIAAPFFSSSLISSRIKIFFIFVLGWVCAFMVPETLTFEHFSPVYIVYMIQEIAFGLLMGFILQLVFEVFALVGQIISMQAGLGFAIMIDPSTKASVPLISQFYLMMTTLVFLSLNGHLALLEALMNSFKVMPISTWSLDTGALWRILMFSGWMFKEAVLITIPAIIALIIVTLTFGIVTRVASQLNIFSLGFPITLMMSFVVMWVCLPTLGLQMVDALDQGLRVVIGLVH